MSLRRAHRVCVYLADCSIVLDSGWRRSTVGIEGVRVDRYPHQRTFVPWAAVVRVVPA